MSNKYKQEPYADQQQDYGPPLQGGCPQGNNPPQTARGYFPPQGYPPPQQLYLTAPQPNFLPLQRGNPPQGGYPPSGTYPSSQEGYPMATQPNFSPPPPYENGAHQELYADQKQDYGLPLQEGYPQGSNPPTTGYPTASGYFPPQGYPPPQQLYLTAPQPNFLPLQRGNPPQGGYPPLGTYPSPQEGYPMATQPNFSPPPPYGNGTYQGYGPYNPGNPEVKGFDQSIRRGFIRKVYSILLVQLLIIMGIIGLCCYYAPIHHFARNTPSLFIMAFILLIFTMITLVCCREIRRKSPMNFIMLFIFTIVEGLFLSVTANRYSIAMIMMAVGITAAVCLAFILFSFQTNYDFTMFRGILLVVVVILLVFGIVVVLVRHNILAFIYVSFGAFIFSAYLVYDTLFMMDGKHSYSLSPEEYVFATLNLYSDIINFFMYCLARIVNHRSALSRLRVIV